MPDLLFELFSEEIPARMQAGAERDLARLAAEGLRRAGLPSQSLQAFAGPRRLTLIVEDLPARQEDSVEERRGPRIGAPERALEGFERTTGLGRQDLTQKDGFWFAHIERPGRGTAEAIAEMAQAIIADFPWPKSMVWGEGELRWVRPLRRILCLFDGKVVPFKIGPVISGDVSEGHRFMPPAGAFKVSSITEYKQLLLSHHVVLESSERRRRITEGAEALCAKRGLCLVADMGLLEEVAGMVEWPAALIGDIAPEFLDLPPEVVRTTMRVHQRYFAVARPDGTLAPHFIAIANLETVDDGTLITAGNVRVLAARLSDARFFWSEDRRKPLEAWLEPLAGVVFHARLGPMADRVERLANLARWIAPHIGADPDEAARAGRLAKADLATGMVGEFPELQGIMGGYYAAASGESEAVAAAIADHYRPQGPSDRVPNAPVSIAVALADKVDLLAAFFSIGEAPTGSRDPFGLRRAALGIIRIVTENRLSVSLRELFAASGYPDNGLEAFAADRLKGLLRDRGARHDLADAVLALGDDDCTRIVEKVEALTEFLANPAGADLLAAYRRAGNILDAEARKGPLPATEPEPAQGAEGSLFDAVRATRVAVHEALATADFRSALESLAELRAPIDRFFDEVLVNSPVSAERANRLSLLQAARAVMGEVADFARISV